MVRTFLLITTVILLFGCEQPLDKAPQKANYQLIPKPHQITNTPGFVGFKDGVFIQNKTNIPELEPYLVDKLANDFEIVENEGGTPVFLEERKEIKGGFEAYVLDISDNEIRIVASHKKGFINAFNSVFQLFHLNHLEGHFYLPCGKVEDHAKFQHRGLLLDCSRHFFSVEVIKKYLDLLAFYKMNVLHWHLTEDQGWRIAIDQYPELTNTGAYRTELTGERYGGFYTKDQIREVVSYADIRGITVIPEIELPGHSQAAIASYPYLSCTGDTVEVANDWGVFKEIYCAGNDSVFLFLENVLTEVMELFPSKYIHIGGDEAPKVRWEQCPKCQARIKNEGLKDEHELQSYFIKRIQKFLKENDRELIGWDEILEGGLAPGAIVQSWRGMNGGVEAVHHGNAAIMSPTSHAYFDYDLKSIDLERVYAFNPIPAEIPIDKSNLILGGECNLWSERIPDEKTLDRQVFPRMLAMSEVLWGKNDGANWEEFKNRVQEHYAVLDKQNVQYGQESLPYVYDIAPKSSFSELVLHPYDSSISFMIFKGSNKGYQWGGEAIKVEDSMVVSVQPIRNGVNYGEKDSLYFDIHKGLNASVQYKHPYSDYYTAGGEKGLVNGKLGSLDFRDGSWQGFYGKDMEVVLDLGVQTTVNKVSARFYQYNNSWVFIPEKFKVMGSLNGEDWFLLGKTSTMNDPKTRGSYIQDVSVRFTKKDCRYVKCVAQSIGKVPEWHEAAGSDSWVFVDEIRIK